jgi:hypothetical protein
VDPHAPTDVLAAGRDPWRPTRRQVVLTVVPLLVVALVGGALTVLVRHVQADRADRRAVRAMAFEVHADVDAQPGDGPSLPLQLRNRAAFEYSVLDVRFDAPGFPAVPLRSHVGARTSLFLDVPKQSGCDPSLYLRGPQALVVRARTARGTLVTVRAPFDRDAVQSTWPQLRRDCKVLLPEEAVSGGGASSYSFRGGTLTVRYELVNAAALPVVVDRIRVEDGIALSTDDLPLTLPAGSGDYRDLGHGTLTLRLRVTDCTALRRALAGAAGGDGLDGPTTLKVDLHHAYGKGRIWLDLSELLPGDTNVDHFQDLVGTCP